MKNSCLQVFSIINSTKKSLEHDNVDIYKPLSFQYNRQREYVKSKIYNIFNDIENSLFSLKDLCVFSYYLHIFSSSIDYKLYTDKNINKVKKLFTKDRLEKDKNFILLLKKQINFTDINFLFKINHDCESMCYDLILNDTLSPLFWIKYCKNDFEFVDESENHKRFRVICEKIKQLLLEVS